MADGAKSTYIADVNAASHYLANMVARSKLMGDSLKEITDRISGLEANAPWGGTDEFGKTFEKQYQAGGGADVVKKQTVVLAAETESGARVAHGAVTASAEVDLDGSKLFRTEQSAEVSTQLAQAHQGHHQAVRETTGVELQDPQP